MEVKKNSTLVYRVTLNTMDLHRLDTIAKVGDDDIAAVIQYLLMREIAYEYGLLVKTQKLRDREGRHGKGP